MKTLFVKATALAMALLMLFVLGCTAAAEDGVEVYYVNYMEDGPVITTEMSIFTIAIFINGVGVVDMPEFEFMPLVVVSNARVNYKINETQSFMFMLAGSGCIDTGSALLTPTVSVPAYDGDPTDLSAVTQFMSALLESECDIRLSVYDDMELQTLISCGELIIAEGKTLNILASASASEEEYGYNGLLVSGAVILEEGATLTAEEGQYLELMNATLSGLQLFCYDEFGGITEFELLGSYNWVIAEYDATEQKWFVFSWTEYGDCNGDGNINAKDVLLLRQYLAEWDFEDYFDGDTADCNADGEINAKDLLRLRQYLAEWDVTLGK